VLDFFEFHFVKAFASQQLRIIPFPALITSVARRVSLGSLAIDLTNDEGQLWTPLPLLLQQVWVATTFWISFRFSR